MHRDRRFISRSSRRIYRVLSASFDTRPVSTAHFDPPPPAAGVKDRPTELPTTVEPGTGNSDNNPVESVLKSSFESPLFRCSRHQNRAWVVSASDEEGERRELVLRQPGAGESHPFLLNLFPTSSHHGTFLLQYSTIPPRCCTLTVLLRGGSFTNSLPSHHNIHANKNNPYYCAREGRALPSAS